MLADARMRRGVGGGEVWGGNMGEELLWQGSDGGEGVVLWWKKTRWVTSQHRKR